MASAPLAAFLRTRKHLSVRDLTHWVIGNEAGDLDSLACAIGYAFFSQYVEPSGPQWIPVVQTPRADLALRPENVLMLRKCGVDMDTLVCADDVPQLGSNAQVALVDHNQATGVWANTKVISVIDHHMDQGAHQNAPLRAIVAPERAGSCASVLTALFMPILPKTPAVPPAVADLLLGAILLDTHNFAPHAGKANSVDQAARAFLAPRSSFATAAAQNALYDELQAAKSDLSQLSIDQKLRRDYKLMRCDAPNGVWQIGTASTVEPLEALVSDGGAPLHDALQALCAQRQLDALVVLAGYFDAANVEHRELLLYTPNHDALSRTLAAHRAHGVDLAPLPLAPLPAHSTAYVQRDARVTRKQFAPALQAVCAQVGK